MEYITNPGTSPLVTISARESNCKPNGLETLNNRAKKPSKKSKKMPPSPFYMKKIKVCGD
jgi:hypothetical protein